ARFDRAGAGAVRARFGHHAFEVLFYALARDDDEIEVRYLQRLGWRAIFLQFLLDGLIDLLTILFVLYVDQVEDDDAVEVAQADLADDLLHRFEVRLDDRVLELVVRLL